MHANALFLDQPNRLWLFCLGPICLLKCPLPVHTHFMNICESLESNYGKWEFHWLLSSCRWNCTSFKNSFLNYLIFWGIWHEMKNNYPTRAIISTCLYSFFFYLSFFFFFNFFGQKFESKCMFLTWSYVKCLKNQKENRSQCFLSKKSLYGWN